jgi:hypothetical protein
MTTHAEQNIFLDGCGIFRLCRGCRSERCDDLRPVAGHVATLDAVRRRGRVAPHGRLASPGGLEAAEVRASVRLFAGIVRHGVPWTQAAGQRRSRPQRKRSSSKSSRWRDRRHPLYERSFQRWLSLAVISGINGRSPSLCGAGVVCQNSIWCFAKLRQAVRPSFVCGGSSRQNVATVSKMSSWARALLVF